MGGLTATLRSQLGRVKRRILPRPPGLLPAGTRLDRRQDLQGYDIGRYSWGHVTVSNRTPGSSLRIGQFSCFAYGTNIVLGGEHQMDFVSTYRFPAYPPFSESFGHLKDSTVSTRGAVVIGNDVWTGHQTLILSGVTIGDGAVVGAGSVVRQNVPPYAIVAGNPARVAGFRFSPEQIEALLRIQWWNWDEWKIMDAMELLMSDSIDRFIEINDVPH